MAILKHFNIYVFISVVAMCRGFFAPSRQKAYLYIILVLYSESTEKMGSVALAVS